MNHTLLNGRPVADDDLRALALVNYGHFTSMQVRDRSVQGLSLHLQRLQRATAELFASALDLAQLRAWLRAPVASEPDCSLRVTVFSRAFDHRRPGETVATDVLVTTAPGATPSPHPVRVKSYAFARPLPHLKHVGTFPLFHHRRLALQAGFDDALFVDAGGLIAEGSVWNLGFWDGYRVVWPQAPALRGVAEQLLQGGLAAAGVAQEIRPLRLQELLGFTAAFACNATGLREISGIDAVGFPDGDELMPILRGVL
ncbi:MAG TPA: aminotransferase class IV family protein, partial [Pseudoxanthomonas sp.]|nr:aminotransferase class IV family protein [Pseudoxanthomonas sp.]